MSDIGTISNLAGANPASARPAPGERSASPEPASLQSAVGRPLTTPQTAVTQAPTTSNAAWQQSTNPDGQQKNSPSQATPTREQLAGTLDQLNQRLNEYNTNLQFEMDDQYQQMVVRIVDRETKDVIRQIPSEKAMAFAKFFRDMDDHQQNPAAPAGGASTKEKKRLEAEGWLLRATA